MIVNKTILLLAFCLCSAIFSTSIKKFEMTTSDNRVRWGKPADVKIVLITYGKEKPQLPLLPSSRNYSVVDSFVSQTPFSSTSIENGKSVEREGVNTLVNYRIQFEKTGKKTIPSLYYSINNDTVRAPWITFDVQRESPEIEPLDTSILIQYIFPNDSLINDTLILPVGDSMQLHLRFSWPKSFSMKIDDREISKILKKLQSSTKESDAIFTFPPQRIISETAIRNGREFYTINTNLVVFGKSKGFLKIPSYSVEYYKERSILNASKKQFFPLYEKEKSFSYSPELLLNIR